MKMRYNIETMIIQPKAKVQNNYVTTKCRLCPVYMQGQKFDIFRNYHYHPNINSENISPQFKEVT